MELALEVLLDLLFLKAAEFADGAGELDPEWGKEKQGMSWARNKLNFWDDDNKMATAVSPCCSFCLFVLGWFGYFQFSKCPSWIFQCSSVITAAPTGVQQHQLLPKTGGDRMQKPHTSLTAASKSNCRRVP